MISNDLELRKRFVAAVDEVVTPAPWLEARVVETIRRVPVRRRFSLGSPLALLPNLRVAAALMAVLIAVVAVAALLLSAHIRTSTVPGHQPTATPSASPRAGQPPWNPSNSPFTPTYVRSADWPPGGQVPANLVGEWNPQLHNVKTAVLYLAGYSFQTLIVSGNVVVNGNEIDFIYGDPCGTDRYHYTLTGDTLVLVRFVDNCHTALPGTYTRLPAGS